MHRCLLPRALPARARCVPNNFLALNRTLPPYRRLTQPWHQYNTAAGAVRKSEDAESLVTWKPSTSEAPTEPVDEVQESGDTQRDNEDATVNLEGYGSQPPSSISVGGGWHQSNTAAEAVRKSEDAEPLVTYKPSTSEAPTESSDEFQESEDTQRGNEDAIDFILEGYESQPPSGTSAGVRMRSGSRAAFYDSLFADKGINRREHKKASNRRPKVAARPRKLSSRKLGPTASKTALLENDLRKRYFPALWARPRWVSLTSLSPNHGQPLNRIWNFNYARAQSVFDKVQHGGPQRGKAPILHPDTAMWVEAVQDRMAENKDINLEFQALYRRIDVANMWAYLSLWMLHYDKDGLVEFLLALPSSESPGPWVADCLQVLAAHYTLYPTQDRAQWVEKLCRIFCALSKNPSAKGMAFDGRFISMILPYATSQQVSELYRVIRVGEFKVHWNTLMHLTRYFATHDHFDQALDALLEAHGAGARTSSFQFRSNCSTLLRKSIERPGGLRVCLRILDNLVAVGVRLNTQLCNIIILNAVETGDVNMAISIYQSLVEHDIKADKYTYAILLKGCKVKIDDAEALNHTIRGAVENFNVSETPVIASEILHCLALHHVRNSSSDAWSIICQAYAQFYELEPLTQLGLPVSKVVRTTLPPKAVAPPSPQAIGIMLRAYLQLNIDSPELNARVRTIYSRFTDLVHNGVQPFADNAKTTYCYNAFLGAFIRQKHKLTDAANVIKDMQHYSSLADSTFCAPDVQSWSIFLHGFTRHGQLKLAEQVLGYMRKKGIEPDNVTWNLLLTGYAGQQDFEGLKDVTARAHDSGHVWDEWTYGGLRRFRNAAKMRELIEGRNQGVPLDFTSDLKEGLESRLNKPEFDEVDEKYWAGEEEQQQV